MLKQNLIDVSIWGLKYENTTSQAKDLTNQQLVNLYIVPIWIIVSLGLIFCIYKSMGYMALISEGTPTEISTGKRKLSTTWFGFILLTFVALALTSIFSNLFM